MVHRPTAVHSGKCGCSSEPVLWSQLSHRRGNFGGPGRLGGLNNSDAGQMAQHLPSSSIFVCQGNGLHRQGKAGPPDITFVVHCFLILSHGLVVCNVFMLLLD